MGDMKKHSHKAKKGGKKPKQNNKKGDLFFPSSEYFLQGSVTSVLYFTDCNNGHILLSLWATCHRSGLEVWSQRAEMASIPYFVYFQGHIFALQGHYLFPRAHGELN